MKKTTTINTKLKKAKKNKNDEFYTRIEDIEYELKNYKSHLKGKIIFCNCDDPEWSNFWRYFVLNFEHLGIKKLIATHFDYKNTTYKLEYFGKDKETLKTNLTQNGDFRSDECIQILKECDIVVTNPPFSLFREYVSQLFQYEKKFIIVGHQNAISYSEIFPLIKNNKLWLGYGFKGSAGHFINKHYEDYATAGDHKEGMIRVSGVHWFTNIEHNKRNASLILYKSYHNDPNYYKHYDNYNAIDVSKTKEIPIDYQGEMGVPITFLDKYNPNQFEIIGLGNGLECFTPNKVYTNPKQIDKNGKIKSGKCINRVLTLNHKTRPLEGIYYVSDNSDYITAPFARLIIKHKEIK